MKTIDFFFLFIFLNFLQAPGYTLPDYVMQGTRVARPVPRSLPRMEASSHVTPKRHVHTTFDSFGRFPEESHVLRHPDLQPQVLVFPYTSIGGI